jgi:xylulose-5-phosphate/fructose-6-phosphate phosphoketolase
MSAALSSDQIGAIAAYAKQEIRDKLVEHREYIMNFGQDMPEIREWSWESTKT